MEARENTAVPAAAEREVQIEKQRQRDERLSGILPDIHGCARSDSLVDLDSVSFGSVSLSRCLADALSLSLSLSFSL